MSFDRDKRRFMAVLKRSNPDSSRLAGKTAASAICHEGRRSVLASIHREGQTMIRMPAQRRDGSQSVRSRIANKEIN